MTKKYKFFNKEISGPFTIPSGIITTEASTLKKIANEISEIGILTTKSIGLEPRQGNREPIIAQYSPCSFVNAVGLTNPGADEFAKKLSKIKIPKNKFLLISIFGSNENEFRKVAEKLQNYADGFELNISCPHSDKYGQVIGQDKKLIQKITKSITLFKKPVFVKISPNLDIKETVRYAIKGGASGITAINTKGPELHLHDNYPVLTNKKGGVSGKAILEFGIKCVKEVREITNLPIIACGGISIADDVKRYKQAGANFFGIGSALAGMNTQEIKDYFHELSKDVKCGTNNAEKFLKDNLNPVRKEGFSNRVNMQYEKFKVKENKQLSEDLFLLELNGNIKIAPGQFIFAWLPEKGEKPFSVLNNNPLTLLIQKRGYFTDELSKLKNNDHIYIRGPYGNSPKTNGKVLLVGGGTGIAGLYLFTKKNKKTSVILGAKDKNHLAYLEQFKENCEKVYLFTENGELGKKGRVTEDLEKIIKKIQPKYCINCGPEIMIEKVVEIESKFLSKEKIYSSAEFLTKCGIGLCGSCATSKGYRSCVDGTFLNQQNY